MANWRRIDLGSFDVDLGDGTRDVDLDKLVPIDMENLSQEFADQPSNYAYVATLAAQAEGAWLDAKRLLELEEAEADNRARIYLSSGNDKVTEGMVHSRVIRDKSYQDMAQAEVQARALHLLMKAIVNAMDQRGEMLISLGAHARSEMNQTGMHIDTDDLKSRLSQLRRQAGV